MDYLCSCYLQKTKCCHGITDVTCFRPHPAHVAQWHLQAQREVCPSGCLSVRGHWGWSSHPALWVRCSNGCGLHSDWSVSLACPTSEEVTIRDNDRKLSLTQQQNMNRQSDVFFILTCNRFSVRTSSVRFSHSPIESVRWVILFWSTFKMDSCFREPEQRHIHTHELYALRAKTWGTCLYEALKQSRKVQALFFTVIKIPVGGSGVISWQFLIPYLRLPGV